MLCTPNQPQIVNRYAAAHVNPQGPGDSRPTALQIIQDEGVVGKLGHKVALVTGGTNGIGLELVRALAKTGMTVFFTSRDPVKGQKVKDKLLSEDAALKLEVVEMELTSLESIKAGAELVLEKTDRLDVLMNNAGIAATPRGFTKEGFEQQFGVNYLAHFYLFQLVKPLLLHTATAYNVNVRIISTSSTSHTASTVLPEDDYSTANPNGRGYEPGVTYAHSNTAKIWFCNELERRYGSKGLHAISIQPGGFSSGLMDSTEERSRAILKKMIEMPHIKKIWKSVEQGAATNTLAAVGKDYDGIGGIYMEDCGTSTPIPDDSNWVGYGFKSWAFDEAGEKKLWTDSLRMVGLKDDQ